MPKFEADLFLDIVERNNPTHAFLVPTQFRSVLEHERSDDTSFACFRCLLSGGAPMPMNLKERVLDIAGHALHELWGLTEGVATFIYPQEIRARPLSVGRPLPDTDIRLIDSDGRELIPPAMGEIVGRSSMLMAGYWNRPDANREAIWTDVNGLSYLRTGDIGELDNDGFLTLRGRLKEMIISGGFNVFPVDIETVLMDHPGVYDAAVIGVPDDKWGEVPIAFIIRSAGFEIDVDDIKSWAIERLGKHQHPADFVFMTEHFPRNALGKVLKNELREQYMR